VNEVRDGFFHCGRCGRFFRAEAGVALVRRCPHCGGDPALALSDRRDPRLPIAAGDIVRDMALGAEPGAAGNEAAAAESRHQHRAGHRRRVSPALRRLVIFIAAWVALLGVVAVVMKVVNDRRESEELQRMNEYKRTRGDKQEGLVISERVRDREFLDDVFGPCQRALTGFLQATSPEERLQWVCDPLRLTGPLSRFYQTNTAFVPGDALENEYLGVIETSTGVIVESLWKGPEGRRIEAVFRKQDDQWRLDWEAFVRFSEVPWVMFVAGGGEEVGEFRLLARERLANERRLEPSISLVMHPPRFGVPDEPGPVSSEFVVPRLSDAGRKLGTLFRMRRDGEVPLGARVPGEDPEDMIRVRVRVRRIDDDKTRRRYEIEEVLAGHWLGIEDTGIPEPGEAEESGQPAEPGSGG